MPSPWVGNHRSLLRHFCTLISFSCLVMSGDVWGQDTGDRFRFVLESDGGGFAFDTGLLSGKLRQQGKPIGITPLHYKGYPNDLSQPYGICSHYRLLDVENRYGVAAWEWAGKAELLDDGRVKAWWTRDEAHPFDLEAVYRWRAADTLDVVTTVIAAKRLRRFEVFLASYLQGFADSFVFVRGCPATGGVPGFFRAEEKNGVWQMFPRDEAAVQMIQDGRWSRPPHPVDWAIMPSLEYPLAIRRDAETGLVAILMSRPKDCFAVATPCSGEGHRSIYFSLFGRDVEPGQPVTARVRLVIGHSLDDEAILHRYQTYAHEDD